MNNKKCVDILNDLLNKINVKGFSFIYEDDYLSIRIPISNDASEYYCFDYCLIGSWVNLNEVFDNKSLYNMWSIEYIINCVLETRKVGNNLGHNTDYLGINDIGVDFLKCLKYCNSLEELKLKLSLRGYDL